MYKYTNTTNNVSIDTKSVEEVVAVEKQLLAETKGWTELSIKTERAGRPAPGTRTYTRIILRPGPMAKVAFESMDGSQGLKLLLAGGVQMYPEKEFFEYDGNIMIKCDDNYWLIIGEQTAIWPDETDPLSFRKPINSI